MGDGPPLVLAALIGLLAWQVMIAAMMLPSSLPLVRLYSRATQRAPRRGRSMAAFIGGYALVWSGFGLAAFGFDAALHAAVDASPWLERHDWWIGGTVLALAGAFQFTPLKDACLDKCRHPGQFLMRYYERGPARRLPSRRPPRDLLRGLLLGADAGHVRGRGGEPDLDGPPDRVMIHEKTRPMGAKAVPVTGVALLGAASIVFAVFGIRSGRDLRQP